MLKKAMLPSLISFTCVGIFLFFAFEYSLSTFLFHNILPFDQKRLLELALLASAPLLSFIFTTYSQTVIGIFQAMRWPTAVSLLMFIFLGLLSCFFAKIPAQALLEWSLYILIIFFSVFWCAVGLTIGKRFFLFNAFLVFFAAGIYIFPLVQSIAFSIRNNLPINFFPFFINPRFFAQFALWTLPLLPLVNYWIKGRTRVLFFIMASLWWALAILDGSRGLLLAFCAASIFGLLIFRKALIPWITRQMLYILSAILLIYLFISAVSLSVDNNTQENNVTQMLSLINGNIAHLNSTDETSINPRLFLYKMALDLSLKHPLLGVGPMHFAYKITPEMKKAKVINGHPHNFPLLILSEWGIPAAISLGIFILILLKNFISALPKNNDDLIAPCYSISLCAGLIYSLVSGVVVMPLSQIMGAIIVANCLMIYFQNTPSLPTPKKAPQIVIGALLLVSLFLVSITVIPNLSALLRAETFWFQEHQRDVGEFIPRFWLQGLLSEDASITTRPE